MRIQRTLVLIKPDALQRGLVGEIISRLEERGLKIVAIKMLQMDEKLARKHYQVHEGKSFFESLLEFMTSGPLVAAIFEGGDAIDLVRGTMGGTDPSKAHPGTIRGDLALSISHNLVHSSDSEESAEEEIALFFSSDEILPYPRETDSGL